VVITITLSVFIPVQVITAKEEAITALTMAVRADTEEAIAIADIVMEVAGIPLEAGLAVEDIPVEEVIVAADIPEVPVPVLAEDALQGAEVVAADTQVVDEDNKVNF
jgi:hypothetical protein